MRRVSWLIVLCLLPVPLCAQDALVLSGGGARGLAHAGAIVSLEDLGYRPSLVVGTSMGAIIGALYGAGYSAEQIRTVVAEENWLELMSATPIAVGADRELRRPLLGFGISRGRFFGGFLSAPGIDQRLIELLFDAGVRARNDFDSLPIPYRAVAADLATGDEVVLGSGDLPRAVRASMAVPGAFTPVQWGDIVLIDGGVANNLPVSVARSLSDEPVIAIDVLRPSEDVEERSALDVALRSLRLLIENARPPAVPDILVLPRMPAGFAETSFPTDASDVMRRGYDAVMRQVPPVALQPETRQPAGTAPPRIGALRVDGADAAAERLIRRIMSGAVGAYNPARIIEGTSSLYRTMLFQAVWPRVEFPTDSEPILVVEVTPVARTSLSGGARWDNDVGASAWGSLRQNVSLATPLEIRLSGTIDPFGQDGSLSGSFFSALVPGMVWNGGVNGSDRRVRIVDVNAVTDGERVRRLGGWAGGELRAPIPNWLFATLIRAEQVRTPTAEGWSIGPFVRIARTPAPDRVVGVDPFVEGEVRGGEIEYQRAELRVSHTIESGSLRIGAIAFGAVASDDAPADALPEIDRDLAPWLAEGASPRRLMAGAGVDLALPLLLNGHVRLRLRALASDGGELEFDTDDELQAGGEIGAIWPTVLGPVAIGAAIGRHTNWRFNIAIGSTF